MLKCFWISFRLRMAYRINSILYALRQIPLVKKVIPVSLYGNKILKNYHYMYCLFMGIIRNLYQQGFVCFGMCLCSFYFCI